MSLIAVVAPRSGRVPETIAWLPVLALVAAAAIGLAGQLHRFVRIDAVLAAVLPIDTLPTDPIAALAGAIGSVALGIGLSRGSRLAFRLAVVAFGAGFVVQAVVLHHPVGAALAAACLVGLGCTRGRYVVDGRASLRGWSGFALAVLTVSLAAEAALALFVITGVGPLTGRADALAMLAATLSFSDAGPLAPIVAHVGVLAALVLAVRLSVAFLAVTALRPAPTPDPGPAYTARTREIARRFGHGALLPFQAADGMLAYTRAEMDGMIAYGVAGRCAVVLGDPIGPDGDRWAAFDGFLETCRRAGRVVAVYQASRDARAPLAARGFRTIQVGREASIDLAGFDLAGSRRANLRHTVTRARAGGVSVRVAIDGLRPADLERLRDALTAIDDAWRAQAGPELGFTVGSFDPATLGSTAIAVAEGADARPIAFATFQPTGNDGGWVLDLMRRVPGGTPGAFEACVVEAALALRASGATTLSLGLVPLSGLAGDAATIEERLLARAARVARPWYDVSGLEFFKRKFDPAWEPRFIAVRSRRDLPGLIVALLRLHLGGLGHAARTTLSSALRAHPAPTTPISHRKPLEGP
jgi:lysylphosphatidylglycerol synthetase-like protein (DUF2156 family)